MSRKINLEELAGRIDKLKVKRAESETTDEYVSYTFQLRHYRAMYERGIALIRKEGRIEKYMESER